MPDFDVIDRPQPRFEGDFAVEPVAGYVPLPAEQAYLAALDRVSLSLAQDEHDDAARPEKEKAVVLARKKERSQTAAELRAQANEFSKRTLSGDIAADNALVIKGKYVGARDDLSKSLFVVEPDVDQSSNLATELIIAVNSNLPPPNDAPSPEKQALFVSISSALTTIRAACERIRLKGETSYWFQSGQATNPAATGQAARLLDEYVRKLAEIARLGLEGSHVQLAERALEGVRTEFVTRQAGRIKNAYVHSLGKAAGIASASLLFVYVLVELGSIEGQFWQSHKPFLLAATGAAVGTWLSFSIRRVSLSFGDLAVLEEDLLDPSMRVIFVIGLTMIACLLFWKGAMNIEIGELKTKNLAGTTAVLVGLFCGIAERALATAISGRAATFVRGVAGGS
jgi:hypothetical protein